MFRTAGLAALFAIASTCAALCQDNSHPVTRSLSTGEPTAAGADSPAGQDRQDQGRNERLGDNGAGGNTTSATAGEPKTANGQDRGDAPKASKTQRVSSRGSAGDHRGRAAERPRDLGSIERGGDRWNDDRWRDERWGGDRFGGNGMAMPGGQGMPQGMSQGMPQGMQQGGMPGGGNMPSSQDAQRALQSQGAANVMMNGNPYDRPYYRDNDNDFYRGNNFNEQDIRRSLSGQGFQIPGR